MKSRSINIIVSPAALLINVLWYKQRRQAFQIRESGLREAKSRITSYKVFCDGPATHSRLSRSDLSSWNESEKCTVYDNNLLFLDSR